MAISATLEAIITAGQRQGYAYTVDQAVRECGVPPTGYEFTDFRNCSVQAIRDSGGFFKALEDIVTNPVQLVQTLAAPLVSVPGVIESIPEKIARKTSPVTDVAYQTGQSLAIGAATAGGNPVALNIGNILNTASGILSGINAGGTVGNVLQTVSGAGQLASQFFPQPTAQMPVAQPPVVYTSGGGAATAPAVARAMAAGLGGLALKDTAKAILAKVSATLGKTMTAAGFATLLRKMAKFFTSPEAIATYLGITVGELYTVWTYSQLKKRRRMNPANGRALRRSVRRIKAFHRMCKDTDVIKPRRVSRGRACGTCRRNPCAC